MDVEIPMLSMEDTGEEGMVEWFMTSTRVQ